MKIITEIYDIIFKLIVLPFGLLLMLIYGIAGLFKFIIGIMIILITIFNPRVQKASANFISSIGSANVKKDVIIEDINIKDLLDRLDSFEIKNKNNANSKVKNNKNVKK